jgi:hypothetical protein
VIIGTASNHWIWPVTALPINPAKVESKKIAGLLPMPILVKESGKMR